MKKRNGLPVWRFGGLPCAGGGRNGNGFSRYFRQKLKINPYGYENSLRKENDGVTYFGYEEQSENVNIYIYYKLYLIYLAIYRLFDKTKRRKNR